MSLEDIPRILAEFHNHKLSIQLLEKTRVELEKQIQELKETHAYLVEKIKIHKSLAGLKEKGLDDNFYPVELQPEEFAKVAEDKKFDVSVYLHEGYDHSYYFIASFVEKHIEFHAKNLCLK